MSFYTLSFFLKPLLLTSLGSFILFELSGCGPASQEPVASPNQQIDTIEKESTIEKLIVRGKTFAAMGDTTRAEQYFSEALSRGAKDTEVSPLLIQVCVQDGRIRLATKYAEEFYVKHRNHEGVLAILGSLYLAIEDYPSAEKKLLSLLQINPNHAEAYYLLGTIYKKQKNVLSADAQFRKYIELDPKGEHVEEAQSELLQKVIHSSNEQTEPAEKNAPRALDAQAKPEHKKEKSAKTPSKSSHLEEEKKP